MNIWTATGTERTLEFPAEPVGTLYLIDELGEFRRYIGEAEGSIRITVPSAHFIELELAPYTGSLSSILSFLSDLKADDLGLLKLTYPEYASSVKGDPSPLQNLRHLTGLRILDLCEWYLDDEECEHLQNLAELRCLDLTSTGIEGPGLKYLTRCTKLRSLHLSGASGSFMRETQGVTRKYRGVNDVGLQFIQDLPNLEVLSLARTDITDAGLRFFAGFNKLRTLDLSFDNIGSEGFGYVSRLHSLETLVLMGTKIQDAGVGCLETLVNLEDLDLSLIDSITDDGLKRLVALNKLRRLKLPNGIGDGGLVYIGQIGSLESLDLTCGCPELMYENEEWAKRQVSNHWIIDKITDDGINALRGLSQLRNLDLSFTAITNQSLQTLSHMQSLETLNLRGTGITAAGLRHLLLLPQLKSIDIGIGDGFHATQISETDIERFRVEFETGKDKRLS